MAWGFKSGVGLSLGSVKAYISAPQAMESRFGKPCRAKTAWAVFTVLFCQGLEFELLGECRKVGQTARLVTSKSWVKWRPSLQRQSWVQQRKQTKKSMCENWLLRQHKINRSSTIKDAVIDALSLLTCYIEITLLFLVGGLLGNLYNQTRIQSCMLLVTAASSLRP